MRRRERLSGAMIVDFFAACALGVGVFVVVSCGLIQTATTDEALARQAVASEYLCLSAEAISAALGVAQAYTAVPEAVVTAVSSLEAGSLAYRDAIGRLSAEDMDRQYAAVRELVTIGAEALRPWLANPQAAEVAE